MPSMLMGAGLVPEFPDRDKSDRRSASRVRRERRAPVRPKSARRVEFGARFWRRPTIK
jgi:hypothetical protein